MVTGGGMAPRLLPLGLQHVVQRPITLQDDAQRGRRPTQHQPRRHHPNSRTNPIKARTAAAIHNRHHQGESRSPTPTSTGKIDSGREKITLQKTAPTQQTPTNPGHHKPGISPSIWNPQHPATYHTQHIRGELQNLSQAMPQRSASYTVQHLQYGTVVDCTVSKVSIDLPTSTTSACGNVALKAGSMENKVFLID